MWGILIKAFGLSLSEDKELTEIFQKLWVFTEVKLQSKNERIKETSLKNILNPRYYG